MGRRKPPEAMTAADERAILLRGISDPLAVRLFDTGMETLAERGEAAYATALQLRDACLWTELINGLQSELMQLSRDKDASPTRARGVAMSKRRAEDARREILDALGLNPRRKRGRPSAQDSESADAEPTEDDAWAAFDAGPSEGAGTQ